MTNPVPADTDIDLRLQGLDPANNGYAAYQATHGRARNVWGTADQVPFATNFGDGNVPVTIATYDQVTTVNEVTAWRHIDPYGIVWNQMKLNYMLLYWLLDGCPTDMGPIGSATNRIPDYITWAKVLRSWPNNYPNVSTILSTFPSEGAAVAYPAFPPSSPTPLDGIASQNVSAGAPRFQAPHPKLQSVKDFGGRAVWTGPNPLAKPPAEPPFDPRVFQPVTAQQLNVAGPVGRAVPKGDDFGERLARLERIIADRFSPR
jgi:hypothetical protein